jgi:hypothetical protein
MSDISPTFVFPRDWLDADGHQLVPNENALAVLAEPQAASILAAVEELWRKSWPVALVMQKPFEGGQQMVRDRQLAHHTKCDDCAAYVRPHRQALLDMLHEVERQLIATQDGLETLAFVRTKLAELSPKKKEATA